MYSTAPALQFSLSPGTVYTTTVSGQYSFANFTLTITNTGTDALQLASAGILLPPDLYLANSLGSVSAVAGQPADWNFGATTTMGAFEATPTSGGIVTMAAGASFTFMLNNVTLAQQTGTVNDIEAMVKLADTTKISHALAVNIAQATAGIASFTSEPTYIAPGQISLLSWQCPGISYCILSPPPNENQLTPSGSTNVSPQTNTTYTLDAYGTDLHVQAQVNVMVERPQVLSFYTENSQVDLGGSLYLNWETQYADSVLLSAVPQMNGLPTNLPVNTSGRGIEVGPFTQATGLSLTPLSNSVPGSVSTPVYIDINPPTATFTASPDTDIWEHDKVTITWEITSAATVSITPDLPGWPSLQNLSGSLTIVATEDINYTLTVTGAPETEPALVALNLTVQQVSINSFNVSPSIQSTMYIDHLTITWDTQAQLVTIDQGVGTVPASGTTTHYVPPSSMTFTLTAGTIQNPNIKQATASFYV